MLLLRYTRFFYIFVYIMQQIKVSQLVLSAKKMTPFKLFTAFIFTLLNFSAQATNYYVNDASTSGDKWCSAIGDDANNGTAVGTPKLTLSDVMDDYDLGAGDIVYIDHGTYSWATIAWWNAIYENNDYGTGTGANVLTIQGAGTGANSAYCTNITCTTNDLFYFQDNSNSFDYITFDGMKLNGSSGNNVIYLGQPDYITISNNIIIATGASASGVLVFNACTNITITTNAISNTSPSGSTYGVNIQQGSVASDVLIEKNNFNCASGSEATYAIWDDQGTTNLTIQNNFIANYLQGVYRDQDRSGFYIYNNSFYCKNYCLQILGSCTSGTWKNNIMYCYGVTASDYPMYLNSTLSAFTSNYNLFYSAGSNYVKWSNTDYATMAAWNAATPGEDINSVTGNPNYTSVTTGNLKITGGPASNVGVNGLVSNDYTSSARNNPPEIGAFEIGSLPITLISFAAECKHKQLEFDWWTASEINNDFFTVERSDDAQKWETVLTIKGAGNSNKILHYNAIEEKPIEGKNYYRLKQTDYDAQYSYSTVISAFDCNWITPEIIVYPNPSEGNFTLLFSGNKDQVQAIEISDAIGSNVFSSSLYDKNIDLSEFAEGIYFIKVSLRNMALYKKLEVHK